MAPGDRFHFESILADPELRKLLDAEVRFRVRERLRLRTTIQTSVMILALALSSFGVWRISRYSADLREAQKALAAAQEQMDAMKDTQQKTQKIITYFYNFYRETIAPRPAGKKPR